MTRFKTLRTILPLLAALVATGWLAGCDNTIDPFSRESYFSIRGYLDLNRSRQFIRVAALNTPIGDTTHTLDATVVLENLATGAADQLKDSVFVFDDGTVTHNFYTDMPIAPETPYRLTVTRSDGIVATAETTTPSMEDPVAAPVEGGDCLTSYTVAFADPNNLYDVVIAYYYEGVAVEKDKGRNRSTWFTQADRSGFRFNPEADLSDVIPSQDLRATRAYEVRCSQLDVGRIDVTYTYVSSNWTEDATPGADIYTSPGLTQSIENGIGFFAAMYRSSFSLDVSTDIYASDE